MTRSRRRAAAGPEATLSVVTAEWLRGALDTASEARERGRGWATVSPRGTYRSPPRRPGFARSVAAARPARPLARRRRAARAATATKDVRRTPAPGLHSLGRQVASEWRAVRIASGRQAQTGRSRPTTRRLAVSELLPSSDLGKRPLPWARPRLARTVAEARSGLNDSWRRAIDQPSPAASTLGRAALGAPPRRAGCNLGARAARRHRWRLAAPRPRRAACSARQAASRPAPPEPSSPAMTGTPSRPASSLDRLL